MPEALFAVAHRDFREVKKRLSQMLNMKNEMRHLHLFLVGLNPRILTAPKPYHEACPHPVNYSIGWRRIKLIAVGTNNARQLSLESLPVVNKRS
jgi:hypothetical protein